MPRKMTEMEIRYLAWELRDGLKIVGGLEIPMSSIVTHIKKIIEEATSEQSGPGRYIGGRIVDVETNGEQAIVCVATNDGTVQRIRTTRRGMGDGLHG